MRASTIYLATGLLRRACMRGFWPIFFVRLVTEVELSPLQLVLLGTVMELSILVFEVPTGAVADLKSRRLSVIYSFATMAIAMALAATAEAYWLLVVSQILIGFGKTFETGAETAWITAELGGAQQAEDLILRRGRLQLVSGVVGIASFAGLAAITSTTVALLAIAAIFAAWGVFLFARMPETAFEPSRRSGFDGIRDMLVDGWAQVRATRAMRVLATVIFIGGVAKEAIDRLDVQRLVDVGVPDRLDVVVLVGIVTSINSLLAAAMLLVTRRKATGPAVVGLLMSLQVATAVGIAVLANVDVLLVAALGLIVQGGAFSAMEPLVISWTNVFASDRARATVHSFIGQAEAFGEILGGIALGIVADLVSVPTAMTISAVLFGVAAVITPRASSSFTQPPRQPINTG